MVVEVAELDNVRAVDLSRKTLMFGMAARLKSAFYHLSSRSHRNERFSEYSFENKNMVRDKIAKDYDFKGDLLDIFVNNKGAIVHKWHHYIPIYDKYFSSFRNRGIRFLEIGVAKGGSLQMWRKYLGGSATIFGIDIDPDCAQLDGLSGRVRIGSQADPAFLAAVIEEMGGVDVVLDDGSHRMDHVKKTFSVLFPQLNEGGIYMIEDLHTAYWENFGGGYRVGNNFFSFVSDIIDDMHHWYHARGSNNPSISDACAGIHIHDSIAVFEKRKVHAPAHSQIGG